MALSQSNKTSWATGRILRPTRKWGDSKINKKKNSR